MTRNPKKDPDKPGQMAVPALPDSKQLK